VSQGLSRLFRFKHLKQLGIADSWSGLRHLQKHQNFPAGLLLGPCSRVWSEDEIKSWLSTRPVEPSEQTQRRARASVEARNGRAA
jgi:predicted DNA-binding transcriptional regulator AlpA